jgi:transcriptional regulator with XRE-family HTH domain
VNPLEHTKNCFGKALRKIRWDKKISQEQLADNSGISRQHISRLECNNDIPSLETLRLIAKGLNISMKDLINEFETIYYKPLFDDDLKVAENNQSKKILFSKKF